MKKILPLIILSGILLGCNNKPKEMIIQLPLASYGSSAVLLSANKGSETNENSLFYKYGKFKVQLIQEENSADCLTGFTNGDYPIVCLTMDMVPLFFEAAGKDSRIAPQILAVSDFSAGADGIVVRGNIKHIRDFKGKKVVLTQNTASQFLMLYLLKQGGLSLNDVKTLFIPSTIDAGMSFATDKTIDACVAAAPFIYYATNQKSPSFIKGASLFTTTAEGNAGYGLIADVFLAREDFIKKYPRIIDAFVKALIEGYDYFSKDTNNQAQVAGMMADFYSMKGGAQEAMTLFKHIHFTGKQECMGFFNNNSSFSAYNLFILSSELYKNSGDILPSDFNVDPENIIYSNALYNALK